MSFPVAYCHTQPDDCSVPIESVKRVRDCFCRSSLAGAAMLPPVSSNPSMSQIPSGREAALHARLLGGDEFAAEAIVIELRQQLEQSLRYSFNNASLDAIVDAVEDALLEYIRRPQSFDSARGVPLYAYLRLAAARNLRDTLRSDARRKARERRYADDLTRRVPPHLHRV